ncbi:uncharacterized protein F54H12.2-like [Porites lutea]|uniref:uncharacterized protein F54H12.2-like n=1 Tax=Porites lutea TaxID=51062 RepID=UPI003CC6C724
MSLNLFDVPDVDYRYEAKRWIPFKPANTGRRPILFTVPSSEDYYDLNETKLEVKVRMNTKGTGGLDDDETTASDGNDTKYVYCVNNFGHTLFNQMNVSFNGVLMTEQSNAYHHKAYVETMLNYSREEGKTTLAAQGWVNELNVRASLTPTNAGTNDKPNPSDWDGKTGLKSLTRRLLGKAYHTFMIKPHVSVFRTGKCLVPGVQIDLELYLNDSNLSLFGTPDTTTSVGKKIPTLEDNDIFVTLWMKKVTLNASVYTRLQKERSLSKTKKVQYPVVRSEIRTYSFDGHSTQWQQDNVFVNKVPGKVIIGLMNSTNYHGSLQHYPFAYQKFGVTRVRETIDGEEYPYRSLELTGNTKAEDLVGYDRFLTASGAYKHHKIPMMRPGDWGQGKNCTLFMFNNVPGDADDPEYRNPRLTGNVRYEIDFRAAVGHNITVVIWSEYENIYEIDQWGGILYSVNS